MKINNALIAFDVNAFDFIVKPVEQERLHKTIQRAVTEIRSERLIQVKMEPDFHAVEFKCIGGIDIRSAQGERVKWKSSKSAELFGYQLLVKA